MPPEPPLSSALPPQATATVAAPSATSTPEIPLVLRFRIFMFILDPGGWRGGGGSSSPLVVRGIVLRAVNRGAGSLRARKEEFGPAYEYGTCARSQPGTGRAKAPRTPASIQQEVIFLLPVEPENRPWGWEVHAVWARCAGVCRWASTTARAAQAAWTQKRPKGAPWGA